MNDLKKNIKLPDIDPEKIIESREYFSPDGAFFIQYVTYSTGILFGNLRGLSQISDVFNYFKIRDEMVEKAGFENYVEIRDNSENANTTREGRAEIVRYYGRLDKRCKALIFANVSLLVSLQVKIGKRVIRNDNLFTTTTSSIEEALQLADGVLADDSVDDIPVVRKDKWNLKTAHGEVRYCLVLPDIIYIETFGEIYSGDYDKIIKLRNFFIEDNSLASKRVYYIHDLKKLKYHDKGIRAAIFKDYLEKGETGELITACFITKKFWQRLLFQAMTPLDKNRNTFIYAKNLKEACRRISKIRTKYDNEIIRPRTLQIREEDFQNIFSLIQQINFNFDEEVKVPETDDRSVAEIFESLLLLRNDINIYMLKLNEKITELQDETKRRMIAEQDLSEKNEKLFEANNFIASVFNTIADGISVIDFSGKLVDCNDAYIAMSGYSEEIVKSKNVFDSYSEEDGKKFRKLIDDREHSSREVFEAVKYRADGTPLEVLISSSILSGSSNDQYYIVSIIKDIGEIKKYQKQLQEQNALLQNAFKNLQQSQEFIIKQEKLASLGTMVAGIAHEINNPTQAIKFSIESLKLNIEDVREFLQEVISLVGTKEGDAGDKLDKIGTLIDYFDLNTVLAEVDDFVHSNLKSVRRVEHIVNSSKRMAYAESIFSTCNINQILEDALVLVDNQIKYSLTVKKELAADIPVFNGLSQELGQVFINLLINSKDAIEDKGLSKDEGLVAISTSYHAERNNIEIRISDNGKGILPENIKKIFDPFFTTKVVGRGTGLGLNLVHRIIDSHNGQIVVESTPGEGSVFIIHLPCTLPLDRSLHF